MLAKRHRIKLTETEGHEFEAIRDHERSKPSRVIRTIALPHLGKRDVFVGVGARRTAVDFTACLERFEIYYTAKQGS